MGKKSLENNLKSPGSLVYKAVSSSGPNSEYPTQIGKNLEITKIR